MQKAKSSTIADYIALKKVNIFSLAHNLSAWLAMMKAGLMTADQSATTTTIIIRFHCPPLTKNVNVTSTAHKTTVIVIYEENALELCVMRYQKLHNLLRAKSSKNGERVCMEVQ